MITNAERVELRRVVRGQFKVLSAEVAQREAELTAEVEEQIAAKFAASDKLWADTAHLAQEAALEANRKVNDLYRALDESHVERMYVRVDMPQRMDEGRRALRVRAYADIKARVKGAALRLQRQEADLMRTLSAGAIESDEAQAFLAAIPTVGELVPAARMTELESGLS